MLSVASKILGYVGLGFDPPEYPTITLATPDNLVKRSWGPQNHPQAKIAMEFVGFRMGVRGISGQSLDILCPIDLIV